MAEIATRRGGSPCLGLRCQASRCRCQRARLARLTRVAATRNPRGITPGSTETTSSLPLRPGKLPLPLASPNATASRVSTGENKRARKSGGSFKDMVR
jgi:hypothetical protein